MASRKVPGTIQVYWINNKDIMPHITEIQNDAYYDKPLL